MPTQSCDRVGTTTTCQLYARSGDASVDSTPDLLPVWVFDDSTVDQVDVMNPVLEAFAGDTITVNLENVNVPSSVSLSLPAVAGEPDSLGVGMGDSTAATFGPLEPGTYLYQAGPTPDGNRQIAMGMAGVLIVRPADHGLDAVQTAYGATENVPLVEYGDELVAITNEFDPRLNADPAGFDMSTFTPSIFTINGKSHDGTNPLPTIQPGSKVLLRAANVGLQQRRLGFAGVRHTQYSENSRLLGTPADVAALTLPPGTVSDAIAMMPVDSGINVTLLDEGLSLFKDSGTAVAGQAQVYALPGMGGTAPSVVTRVAVNPEITDGTSLLVDADIELEKSGFFLVRYFFDNLVENEDGWLQGTDTSQYGCTGASCSIAGFTVEVDDLPLAASGERRTRHLAAGRPVGQWCLQVWSGQGCGVPHRP